MLCSTLNIDNENNRSSEEVRDKFGISFLKLIIFFCNNCSFFYILHILSSPSLRITEEMNKTCLGVKLV